MPAASTSNGSCARSSDTGARPRCTRSVSSRASGTRHFARPSSRRASATTARWPRRPASTSKPRRQGIHVDRIASAWLIRERIDPAAVFKFVPARGYQPAPGELRFDMYEAEFTHDGELCTFEVLLREFGLEDAGLRPIAEIVHAIDLKVEEPTRPETPGVAHALEGIARRHRDDGARLRDGAALFGALHAYFAARAGRR